jgi:hypothetical protein
MVALQARDCVFQEVLFMTTKKNTNIKNKGAIDQSDKGWLELLLEKPTKKDEPPLYIGFLVLSVLVCFLGVIFCYEGNLEYYGVYEHNNTFKFGNSFIPEDYGPPENYTGNPGSYDENNDGDGGSLYEASHNKWFWIVIGILTIVLFMIFEYIYIKNPSIKISNDFIDFIFNNIGLFISALAVSLGIIGLGLIALFIIAALSELVILLTTTLVMTMVGVYLLSAIGAIAAFIYVKYLLFKKYTSNLLKLKKVARKKR